MFPVSSLLVGLSQCSASVTCFLLVFSRGLLGTTGVGANVFLNPLHPFFVPRQSVSRTGKQEASYQVELLVQHLTWILKMEHLVCFDGHIIKCLWKVCFLNVYLNQLYSSSNSFNSSDLMEVSGAS